MVMQQKELTNRLQEIKKTCDIVLATGTAHNLVKSTANGSHPKELMQAITDKLQEIKSLRDEFNNVLLSECYRFNSEGKTDKTEVLYREYNKLFTNAQNHLLELKNDLLKEVSEQKSKASKKNYRDQYLKSKTQQRKDARAQEKKATAQLDSFAKQLLTASKKYKISPKQHSLSGLQAFQKGCQKKDIAFLTRTRNKMQADLDKIQSTHKQIPWHTLATSAYKDDGATAQKIHAIVKNDLHQLIGIVDTVLENKIKERPEKEASHRMKELQKATEATIKSIKKASSPSEVSVLEKKHKIQCQTTFDLLKGTTSEKRHSKTIDIYKKRVIQTRGKKLLTLADTPSQQKTPTKNPPLPQTRPRTR